MRMFVSALLAACLAACSGAADEQSVAQQEIEDLPRERVEQIVRDYILQNPEIIEEALLELQNRASSRRTEQLLSAVLSLGDELYNDERDPVAGAEDPDLRIIEFFDYRCPYCRATSGWVENTLDEHGDRVQFIFKEFPILGPQSIEASQASYAVWLSQPEHYEAFHHVMMQNEGDLPSDRIDEIAAEVGIDVTQMREDMQRDEIFDYLTSVRDVAQTIGISGTPFYIINETVVPGADLETLEATLAESLGL